MGYYVNKNGGTGAPYAPLYLYMRVVAPGSIAAGDQIVVSHRPDHQVTVAALFRSLTTDTD